MSVQPYYQDDYATIYHGDCRDVLPQLGAVDLVLTDPPYSLSVSSDHQHKPGKGTRKLNFFPGDTDWQTMTDYISERLLLAASLAPAIYIWCGHRQFGRFVADLEAAGFQSRFLVWRKLCPVPAPPGVGWDSAAELCVYAFKNGRKWLPPTGTKVPNVIEADSYRHGMPGKVGHPTQKPMATALIPLRNSCAPGDVILDPFMGSGTTLRAAKDLGLKSIGIEIDEDYCKIAVERLRQESLLGLVA